MQYPINVKLQRPIKDGDETIEELNFDEPDLGTSLAVEDAEKPSEQTVILLSGMAGVSRELFLKVKETDFRVIGERVLAPYQAEMAKLAKDAEGNGKPAR